MKNNQKQLAIFFIEGNGVVIASTKQPQGTNFPFPSGSVEHMEILNHDAIRDMVAQACATLELADSPGLIVFGKSLTFEKQVTPLPEDKLHDQVEVFKDATPFERVASHVYKNPQGSLLVSINRDFYDTLRQILERAEVHIIGVVPQFVLTGVIGTGPISSKSLKLLTSKVDELSAASIVTHKEKPKTLQEKQEYISKKYSGVVVAVFILFLFLVFGATAYILQSQFKASRKSAPITTPVTSTPPRSTPVSTPTNTPEITASASAIQIIIIHAPEVASQAAGLRSLLRDSSYTQVTTQAQPGLQTSTPLLTFKTSVPVQNRAEIQNLIKTVFPSISVQERTDLSSDVSVTLGK